jgi:hypothetical protein
MDLTLAVVLGEKFLLSIRGCNWAFSTPDKLGYLDFPVPFSPTKKHTRLLSGHNRRSNKAERISGLRDFSSRTGSLIGRNWSCLWEGHLSPSTRFHQLASESR